MVNKMFGLTCACCGADITAPQFYKGKAYGYTCILKVNPEAKQVKAGKAVFAKGELISIVGDSQGRQEVTILVNGKRLVDIVYGENWRSCTKDGVIMLIGYDGKARYKSVSRENGVTFVNGLKVNG